jgi:ATP-binding cassette subfamily C (CFTR/MRP) protein 1
MLLFFTSPPSLSSSTTRLKSSKQHSTFFVAQTWLSIRLEFAGAMIIMSVVWLLYNQFAGNEHFAGLAGLSISFALSITSTLNWTVRMASDLEGNLLSFLKT